MLSETLKPSVCVCVVKIVWYTEQKVEVNGVQADKRKNIRSILFEDTLLLRSIPGCERTPMHRHDKWGRYDSTVKSK